MTETLIGLEGSFEQGEVEGTITSNIRTCFKTLRKKEKQ